jgi:hypothetical protein
MTKAEKKTIERYRVLEEMYESTKHNHTPDEAVKIFKLLTKHKPKVQEIKLKYGL